MYVNINIIVHLTEYVLQQNIKVCYNILVIIIYHLLKNIVLKEGKYILTEYKRVNMINECNFFVE